MMNTFRLLFSQLRKVGPTILATRFRALRPAVDSATHHQRLTLTNLGRGLGLSAGTGATGRRPTLQETGGADEGIN